MNEKIIKFVHSINLNSIWEMFVNSIKQLGITFLPIIISIILLTILGENIKDIISKKDILGGAIITSVCISLQVVNKKNNKENPISLLAKVFIIFGIICYIVLTISDKFNDQQNIQYDCIEKIMWFGIILSILLVFLSNYDASKAEILKNAIDGRNIKEGRIGNKNLNLGE